MTSSIYLAIDTPSLDRAIALVKQVRHHIGGIKLGLEFFCANGHHGVHEMRKLGLPIFLDLKLHDIPNTVAKAVQALHALETGCADRACRGRTRDDGRRQSGRGREHQGRRRHGADQPSTGTISRPSASRPIRTSRSSGSRTSPGMRASTASSARAREVAHARKIWPSGFFVVPGVRPAGATKGDQKRGGHAATGARCRRLDPRHRPGDHQCAGAGSGGAGN